MCVQSKIDDIHLPTADRPPEVPHESEGIRTRPRSVGVFGNIERKTDICPFLVVTVFFENEISCMASHPSNTGAAKPTPDESTESTWRTNGESVDDPLAPQFRLRRP